MQLQRLLFRGSEKYTTSVDLRELDVARTSVPADDSVVGPQGPDGELVGCVAVDGDGNELTSRDGDGDSVAYCAFADAPHDILVAVHDSLRETP